MSQSKNMMLNLKIGDYEVIPLPTGLFGLDGGAMFGTVPKVLWQKSNPPDELNRIPMEARSLLLKSKDKKIIIDCGNGSDFVKKYGEKLGSKFTEMYNIDDHGPSLKKSLARAGVQPEEVTDVILTHLHFDHAGGATEAKGDQIVPSFPKANYYLQDQNLITASNPNLREKASYFSANYQPLVEAKVLKLVKGSTENLLPGISVLTSDGHTQGQQMVKISDGKTTLLYCADVVPTSSHVRVPWLMGYDLNPVLLMEEKIKYLSQAADQNWYLYFEHDPYCDAALIQRNGSDFQVKQRFSL
jgi:glyoxylase-like metal-dependent hydrolase (beta-lactamase superfamily II)